MDEFTFYSRLFEKLNSALTTYVSDVATNVIGAIGPVAAQLLTLYFIIHGIALMRGLIEEPITDFAIRVVRISLILGIALNIGFYNGEVVSFIWNTPEALAAYVSGAAYTGDSSMNFLDGLMSEIYNLGQIYWSYDSAGPSVDIGPKIIAVMIWVAGLLVTAYGAFLFVLAKMALAVLLGLGPLFILLLMFEGTKRFFESWLGQALNYVFVVVLTSAVIKLILTIIQVYLPTATSEAAIDATMAAAIPAIAFCVIGSLVMMQLSSVASALGGGVAVSTLGAGAAVWSKAKGAAGATGRAGLSLGKKAAKTETARNAGAAVKGMPMAAFRKITASPSRGSRV